MVTQTQDHQEEKKTWQTPEIIVYGDIEKITGERITGGFTSNSSN